MASFGCARCTKAASPGSPGHLLACAPQELLYCSEELLRGLRHRP